MNLLENIDSGAVMGLGRSQRNRPNNREEACFTNIVFGYGKEGSDYALRQIFCLPELMMQIPQFVVSK